MPTKPRDIEQLAIELSRRTQPAELRAAVGRAYYAAFNAAAEMLRGWKFHISQNAGGHGEVLRYLGNSGDVELIAAGNQLAMLRSRRNAADYDLSATDIERAATTQLLVKIASQLLNTFDVCRLPQRSPAIIAAIEDYQRRIAPQPP